MPSRSRTCGDQGRRNDVRRVRLLALGAAGVLVASTCTAAGAAGADERRPATATAVAPSIRIALPPLGRPRPGAGRRQVAPPPPRHSPPPPPPAPTSPPPAGPRGGSRKPGRPPR